MDESPICNGPKFSVMFTDFMLDLLISILKTNYFTFLRQQNSPNNDLFPIWQLAHSWVAN